MITIMELYDVTTPYYALPVGFVFIFAILIFTFGFKSAELPEFNQLTDENKKYINNKKKKVKDTKKQHVEDASRDRTKASVKQGSPVKQPSRQHQSLIVESVKGNNHNSSNYNKKAEKKHEFMDAIHKDDDGWEQAFSRKDKKSKRSDENIKKDKDSTSNKSPAKKKLGGQQTSPIQDDVEVLPAPKYLPSSSEEDILSEKGKEKVLKKSKKRSVENVKPSRGVVTKISGNSADRQTPEDGSKIANHSVEICEIVESAVVDKNSLDTPKFPKKAKDSKPVVQVQKKAAENPILTEKSVDSEMEAKKIVENSKESKKVVNSPKVSQNPVESTKVPKNAIGNPKVPRNGVDSPKVSKNAVNGSRVPKNGMENTKVPKNSSDSAKALKNVAVNNKIPKNGMDSAKAPKIGIDSPNAPKDYIDNSKNPVDISKVSKNAADNSKVPKIATDNSKVPKNAADNQKTPKYIADYPKVSKSALNSTKVPQNPADNSKTRKNSSDNPKVFKNTANSPKASKSTIESSKQNKIQQSFTVDQQVAEPEGANPGMPVGATIAEQIHTEPPEAAVAFDELGDVWKEAKMPKKKKKVRKE